MSKVTHPVFPWRLYVLAAIISLTLSLWLVARVDIINPDGICYLQAAATIGHDYATAVHMCNGGWSFYEMSIAVIVKLTHMSEYAAALCLNAAASLLSVFMFISIVRRLTPESRIHWLAAGVILLAHQFNALRIDVIRDHGFWAFYLTSIYFLLRYLRLPTWRIALAWSVSLVVATLFRVEGAFFLILLPLPICLAAPRRLRAFLQLNTLLLAVCVLLTAWLILHPQASLNRLDAIRLQLLHGPSLLLQNFFDKVQAFRAIISSYAYADAPWVLAGSFILWYLISVARNISLIYAALVLYGWCQRVTAWTRPQHIVIGCYVAVNVAITFVFLVEQGFLSDRYLLALSLTLMLWVPFAISKLLATRWRWIMLLAILYYAIAGIGHFGPNKSYLRVAGTWLAGHAQPHDTIYSNDYQLLYYTHHFGNTIFSVGPQYADLAANINQDKWRRFQWLAIRVDHEGVPTALAHLPLTPVVVFHDNRHNEVRIYHVNVTEKQS